MKKKSHSPSLKKNRSSAIRKRRSTPKSQFQKKNRAFERSLEPPIVREDHSHGKEGPLLLKALKTPVSPPGQQSQPLTHGFHAYPGRFHPMLVQNILRTFGGKGGIKLFDPFMGGGTALVEGMCQGFEVIGNDLNPMAKLVARERCRLRILSENRAVLDLAKQLRKRIVESQEHVKKRIVHRANISWLRSRYAPHLFVEMLYWIDEIEKLPPSPAQETLQMVFCDLVFKFSNQSLLDASLERKTPPLPKGAVSRWMLARTEELLKNQQLFNRKVPRETQPAKFFSEDFVSFTGLPESSVDLIITAPPAPGTWDYYEYHLLQYKWLNLSEEAIKNHEAGSKRRQTPRQWQQSFRTILLKMRKLLKPGASCFLVLSDWLDQDGRVSALGHIQKFAPSVGWKVSGRASVQQKIFNAHQVESYGNEGKWEHLIHLVNPAKHESGNNH
ncbi:MAG: hypothetical protein HQM13_03790 [SAR324 cluster bacterium]|nr:hypothetical protein [SAR324 cluster bacterium]